MRLVIVQAPGQIQPNIFELNSDPPRPVLRIGRHNSNDIVISDASVSRQHTEIRLRPEGILVRDLGSSNGTFVNQQRLAPGIQTLLKPGQELKIGNIVTILEDDGLPAPPEVAPNSRYQPVSPASSPPIYQNSPPPTSRPAPALPNRLNPPNAVAPHYRRANGDNEIYPMVQAAPAPRSKPKAVTGLNWFLIGVLLGLVLLAIAALALFLSRSSNNGPNNSAPITTVPLPLNVFASPANNEGVLGITLARPSVWQKAQGEKGAVIFTKPGASTTTITLEKAPGPTIGNPNLTSEAALGQYIANAQANSQGFRLLLGPGPTKLNDATPGYFARLVFTTAHEPLVTNYTVNALAFKCGDSLYFATAAAEGKDYNGATQQDLEAAIANFKC